MKTIQEKKKKEISTTDPNIQLPAIKSQRLAV